MARQKDDTCLVIRYVFGGLVCLGALGCAVWLIIAILAIRVEASSKNPDHARVNEMAYMIVAAILGGIVCVVIALLAFCIDCEKRFGLTWFNDPEETEGSAGLIDQKKDEEEGYNSFA